MKKLFKKLFPALALTLMIAGTVVASNNATNQTKAVDEWYGLPEGTEGPRIPLDNAPSSQDCDIDNPADCYVHVTDQGEEFFDGGLYIGQ